jgi:hypothetical protein
MMGCCSAGGACQVVEAAQMGDCNGTFLFCHDGVTNVDGTMDCWD